MKAKSIQYSVPDPCHKSWNEMTPEAGGRFCGSCEKSVVDFTGMSDFSIVSYLENHKAEKVCGRFTKPQLDRVYQLNQPVFAPTFDLRAVVLGLALTTFCALHSFSQTEVKTPETIDTTINALDRIPPIVVGTIARVHFDHSKEKVLTGKVSNASNDFKTIIVTLQTAEGKVLKTIKPDAKGKFTVDLDWKLKPVLIEVSGSGYETQQLYFATVKSLSNIQIHLLDETEMIRGEIIQGDVYEAPAEDQILQKIEMGNVKIEKSEK